MASIQHLRSAFPHLSVEQINEALLHAGGDPNRASEALLRTSGRPPGGPARGGGTPAGGGATREPGPSPPDLRRDPEGWFRFFDREGNGLQQHQVAVAVAQTFRTIPSGAARELVKGLWPLFDTDGSGSISMEEFNRRDGLRDALLAQMGAGERSSGSSGSSGGSGAGRPGARPSTAPVPVVQGILLDDSGALLPPGPGGKGGRGPHAGGKAGGGGRGGRGGKGGEEGSYPHHHHHPAPGAKGAGKGGKTGGRTAAAHGAPPATGPGAGAGAGGALPSFEEVLAALRPLHRRLGGTPFFGRKDPFINGKLKSYQLEKSSDYEYVFLTVVGFQALQRHGAEIIRLNNGQHFKSNPGTMRLEELSGFTMHGDRPGANGILRTGPEALLRAFEVARRRGLVAEFFTGEAFDRTADPCLEGRLGRILAFLEAHGVDEATPAGEPPPADLAIEVLPEGAPAERVVGEHLRVYRNRCIHQWAKAAGLPYDRAKALWEAAEAGTPPPAGGGPRPDVRRLCNDAGLLRHLEAAGLVADRPGASARALPAEEVRRAVRFFVEMETLCAA